MAGRGISLVLVGLVIGILAGLSIVGTERYIAAQLIDLLDGEAREACPCNFEIDDLKVSLLSLSAQGRNGRVSAANGSQLHFATLKAQFSLSAMRQRQILLTELQLRDGQADGIGPGSAAYDFIDYLAEPIAPERDHPGRWRIRLLSLTVKDSIFKQMVADRLLQGNGVNISLVRTPADYFILTAQASDILLSTHSTVVSTTATPTSLGHLSGVLHLQDERIAISQLRLQQGRAYLAAQDAVVVPASAALSGTMEYQINNDWDLLPAWLEWESAGRFRLSGTLDCPQLLFDLAGAATGRLALQLAENRKVDFGQLQLQSAIECQSGQWGLRIAAAEAAGPDGAFKLTRPLLLSAEAVSAALAGEIRWSPAPLDRIDFNVALSGSLENLQAALNAELGAGPKISGTATIDPGPLGTLRARADFDLSVPADPQPVAFVGELDLAKGALHAKLRNSANSLTAQLQSSLDPAAPNQLQINFQNLKGSEINPRLQCTEAGGTIDYSFSWLNPTAGSGRISLTQLDLGCRPYTLRLPQPQVLPIAAGRLVLTGLTWTGLDSFLRLKGAVSFAEGLDLAADGNLRLNTLLPLLPEVDDLSGLVEGRLQIQGPWGNVSRQGDGTISDGSLAVEAGDLDVQGIKGTLRFTDTRLQTEDLRGVCNGGACRLRADLDLNDLENSQFELHVNDLLLEPQENLSALVSANLSLQTNNGEPQISGEVLVESALFHGTFDLVALLRYLTDYVLRPRRGETRTEQQARPNLRVDVNLRAPRNISIVSNLMEAEFAANLNISGTSAQPLISGEMETLGGWFGIRKRRFVITSGRLIFAPTAAVPLVELVGETQVFTGAGDSIYLVAEASGPLNAPTLILSSDSELTQAELLQLLSAGATATDSGLGSASGQTFSPLREKYLEPFLGRELARFLTNLTAIDSLAIEPELNIRSGLVEPTLVAQKSLFGNFTLLGQSFPDGEGLLELGYQFSPNWQVRGRIDNYTVLERISIGADVSYRRLSTAQEQVKLNLNADGPFRSAAIWEAAGLSPQSRLRPADTAAVAGSLQSFYRKQGYFAAEVTADCRTEGGWCRELNIVITAGPQTVVREIAISGAAPPEVDLDALLGRLPGAPATEELLRNLEQDLIRRLRAEGYIAARVSAAYETDGTDGAVIRLRLTAGQPLTFIFTGNYVFRPVDFLKTINLFERRQPFGANTIKILIERMERLYREAGYLYASINYEQQSEPDGRLIYLINISEEQQIRVAAVELKGLDTAAVQRLQTLLRKRDRRWESSLMQPQFAVAEEFETNVLLLEELLREQGFPEAAVSYQIKDTPDPSQVLIVYTISAGTPLQSDWLSVVGWPPDLKLPQQPAAPYSIPKANQYIQELLQALKNAGYLEPQITTELADEFTEMQIRVRAGERTIIEAISVTGHRSVATEIILARLGLKAGDPWEAERLSRSRRKLLKLGLFSRVTLEAAAGTAVGKQKLIVRVEEQPLQVFEAGAGLNSELGLHFFGQATDKSFFSDGRSLSLRLDGYLDPTDGTIPQGIASLRYYHPELLGWWYDFSSDNRIQRLEQPTLPYDLDRFVSDNTLYNFYSGGLTHTFGYTFLQENLGSVAPDAILSRFDRGSHNHAYLSGSVQWDRRDNPLNPAAGFLVGADYKFAHKTLGSEAAFLDLRGRASFTRRLGYSPWVLANRSTGGLAWAFDNTPEVPLSHRYFIGGRNSVRGFEENSLSPRGSAGTVIGGNAMAYNNLELRYFISDIFSVHWFLDSGFNYLRGDNATPREVRNSTGAGLRYHSPIGSIGLDLGGPLDRKEYESSLRLHFNIGATF